MKSIYKNRLSLLKDIPKDKAILDLGTINPITEILFKMGYNIWNTQGEDLDFNRSCLDRDRCFMKYKVITAFEILEHLYNPFTLLREIRKGTILLISVPLRHLWLKDTYRHEGSWMNHFHEFEKWQIIGLLEKTGFEIIECFTGRQQAFPKRLGIRPIIRYLFKENIYIKALKK